MDLLSRLIAGKGATSSAKQRANPSTERLASCKKLCIALQSIWRKEASLSEDDTATIHVKSLLVRLNSILKDESGTGAPHSCLAYAASSQIYIIVAKLALSSTSPDVISAATEFFHLLIHGEAEGVIDSKVFARSLVDLVRRFTGPVALRFNDIEAALIELLFEIVSIIRAEPDILPAWFYPERSPGPSRSMSVEFRRSQFPLFYILIDYVHYDGRTGDFARTALLYLTETASKSRPLEIWMMESDLTLQMASGLSALYSRLSRQVPAFDRDSLPILAFSDGIREPPVQIQDSPEDVTSNMKGFLSYLAFWQDTINHCKSDEVKDTLLDHFQIIFVQQLLYPSLLESSDVSGGSTAAVVLHLCRILDSLDNQQLVSRMLQYLFATRTEGVIKKSQRQDRSRMSISRRRSMDELASLVQSIDNPSPELFNLSDLIVFTLRSSHPQTVIASLRLVSLLLHRHHHHIRRVLFDLHVTDPVQSKQNLNGLNSAMMTLFDLSNAICQTTNLDQSYQAALDDGQTLLERHSCLLSNLDDPSVTTTISLALSPTCKLFEVMSDLLLNWFANDTPVNLELSGTFVALAACQHVLLRSWLLPSAEHPDGSDASVLHALQSLVDHVKQWRTQFVEWDTFYSIQKVDLASEDDIDMKPAHFSSIERKSPLSSSPRSPSRPQSLSRPRPSALDAGIDGRLARSPRMAASALNREIPPSPLQKEVVRREFVEEESLRSPSITGSSLSSTLLSTQIPLPLGDKDSTNHDLSQPLMHRLKNTDVSSRSETSDGGSGAATPNTQNEPRASASLRHILTQAVMLQEFILELAAILQVRATLFDEVDLS